MVKGPPLLNRDREIAGAGTGPGPGKRAPDPAHGGLSPPVCTIFRKGIFYDNVPWISNNEQRIRMGWWGPCTILNH